MLCVDPTVTVIVEANGLFHKGAGKKGNSEHGVKNELSIQHHRCTLLQTVYSITPTVVYTVLWKGDGLPTGAEKGLKDGR